MYRYLSIYKIALINLAVSGFFLIGNKGILFISLNASICLINACILFLSLSNLPKFMKQNHERLFIGRKRSQIVISASGFFLIHVLAFSIKFIHKDLLIFDIVWSWMIVTVRLFEDVLSAYLHKSLKKGRRVAVVGYNDYSIKIAEKLKRKGKNFFYGHIDFENNNFEVTNESYLSPYIDFAKKNHINEFYLSVPKKNQDEIDIMAKEAEKHCIRVKFIAQGEGLENTNYRTQYISGLPVLKRYDEPLVRLRNQTIKRAFDIAISGFVTLFLLSWLIPLIGILIKLESKGPVFFRQDRSGRNNEPFSCLKFRSMKVNDLSDSKQATQDDDRITKVGAFLRKTSLDELPQFLNVLKGEMSIVGPRPHMLRHTEEYNEQVNSYMVRLWLKPGLTGWAQANGFRGEVRHIDLMKKRVEYDIWYMENWTIFLDIKIFWLTLAKVFKGDENAY